MLWFLRQVLNLEAYEMKIIYVTSCNGFRRCCRHIMQPLHHSNCHGVLSFCCGALCKVPIQSFRKLLCPFQNKVQGLGNVANFLLPSFYEHPQLKRNPQYDNSFVALKTITQGAPVQPLLLAISVWSSFWFPKSQSHKIYVEFSTNILFSFLHCECEHKSLWCQQAIDAARGISLTLVHTQEIGQNNKWTI